jgi:hypothetical protein
VTTLSLVQKVPLVPERSPDEPLLARFVERIVQLPWPGERDLDAVLARAIEEAFASLAREARS